MLPRLRQVWLEGNPELSAEAVQGLLADLHARTQHGAPGSSGDAAAATSGGVSSSSNGVGRWRMTLPPSAAAGAAPAAGQAGGPGSAALKVVVGLDVRQLRGQGVGELQAVVGQLVASASLKVRDRCPVPLSRCLHAC